MGTVIICSRTGCNLILLHFLIEIRAGFQHVVLS